MPLAPVEELKEYINLPIYKLCTSFTTNIDENITKAEKKVCYFRPVLIEGGLTLQSSSRFENKQACTSRLLLGSELWNLTPSDIVKLDTCHRWFGRKVFYLRSHSDVISLHSISCFTSVELQIYERNVFFFARVVSSDGISPVLRDIFNFKAKDTSETLNMYPLDYG